VNAHRGSQRRGTVTGADLVQHRGVWRTLDAGKVGRLLGEQPLDTTGTTRPSTRSSSGQALAKACAVPRAPTQTHRRRLEPLVVQLQLQLAGHHVERLIDRGVRVRDRPRLPGSKGALTDTE
jgi:hypothetical protein